MHELYELSVHGSKLLANCYSTKVSVLVSQRPLIGIMSCNYL